MLAQRVVLGLLLGMIGLAVQALELPALTGRVVDQAELLDGPSKGRLEQMLGAHEQATGEQLVVVTVPDLQGRSIEEFGVALGRRWGIGEQGKDNGALLIVAHDERKIRIEVGYGLEGRLTDAQSSLIINGIIAPAFKQGDFAGGISAGVTAMIQVLGGDPLQRTAPQAPGQEPDGPLPILYFFLLLVVMFLLGGGRGGRGGGGGGFGGGGASGGW